MRSLTWDDVRSRRLARSHLVERAPAERLVEVVRNICGIHAQVMGSAELQLAARVDGITQTDVRDALWERRSLAKTWTLRGTLHFHPADELRLWTAAREAVAEPLHRDLVAAFGAALAGRELLREELAEEMAARVGEWTREQVSSGWAFLFRTPEAKALFARLGLAELEVEGRSAWWLVDEEPAAERGSVRLLPEYDVYVMGFREREQLVRPAVREQVAAHGKGRYEGPAGTPLLLVDGVCAGIWSRRKTTKRIDISVEPARKLTPAERAGIDAETERIGAFWLEPRLAIV